MEKEQKVLDRVATSSPALALRGLRVRGGVALGFRRRGDATVCDHLREADGYRARLPAGDRCEAVILNTGGGVAGGDSVAFDIAAGEGAQACVTSVAAERVYRSNGPAAEASIALAVGADARLAVLPQETILYDGACLERRIEIDCAPSAEVTYLDVLVFGRRGSGERMRSGLLRDRWCVRRAGRLVHREALSLNGDIDAQLAHPAAGAGAHVTATLLHLAPDAADRLEAVRTLLPPPEPGIAIAASAWDGKLLVRALAHDAADLLPVLCRLTPVLTGIPMPRSWAA